MPAGIEPAAVPDKECLQVGEWTVEPTLNQLSAVGSIVKLEPKAMAVLVHLAGRPRQVVSREALLSAVWPGVVVGDDSLTQVVVKLRKALGDAPEEPAYIQTISKRGYRLVAPVVRSVEQPPAPVPADVEPPHAEQRRRHVPWLAGAGIIALLIAAVVSWWTKNGHVTGVPPDQVATESVQLARSAQPAVVIRPFEALGNDPQEVLLARGITADLVTDLSKVFGLWIVGAEAMNARAGSEAPGAVSAPLYVVSGTVQRADDRLRLHVRLTEVGTGKLLWSERFESALAGFFEIQDELGPKILHVLPVKVSEAELRRVMQRHTRNLEAYEYFQRGQSALHVRRRAENEAAREMFRRAIGLDAGFARAYTGLAQTYAADYRNQWTEDRAALDRAFELARTAHQIKPDIPETYWMLAYVHVHRHEHDQALRHLETAVRLNPSYADGYAFMGGIYTGLGRPAEGVRLLRIAMRLMPESGYLYFMLLGRAYLFLGDLEQARVNLEHALSRNPEFLDARVYMAAAHLAAGDKAAAAWEAEEIRTLQPGFSVLRWLETNPTADAAMKTRLVQALSELGF